MSVAVLRRPPGAHAANDPGVLWGLALATVLATVWAVIAGGWGDGMTVALATTAVAVVEAGLIAASQATRATAALAAPVLGILVIVPLTVSGMPAAPTGQGGAAGLVEAYARALSTGIVSSDSWAFVVGLCAGLWLLGFWTAWLAVREHDGLLAVLPCYGVLASNALNAPALRDVALPEALALTASLLLLARAHLARLDAGWTRRRIVALPGTRGRFTWVAIGAVVLVVLLGLVAPPVSDQDLSGRIFHFTVNDLGGGGGGGRGGHGAPVSGAISFSPDTRPGGALVDNPRKVLAYTASTSGTVYLRDVTDVRFDAGNWTPALPSGRLSIVQVSVDPSDPLTTRIARDHAPEHSGDRLDGTQKEVHVRLVLDNAAARGSDDHALFAGEPEGVGRSADAFGVTDRADYGVGGGLETVDFVRLLHGYVEAPAVDTYASVSTASEAQLRAAGTAYPAWLAREGYLQTDQSSYSAGDRRQLADIASLARRWTAGAATPYDQARAIETQLRSFRYTLSPAAAAPGEWPIHHFLLTSKAAYCQYFASSMGAMLRLTGIPSRLVSGYGPGNLDDSTRGSLSGLHQVTTTDAHVWVEAYFPGYGWIPFEPTPGSEQGLYEPFQRPAAAGAEPPPSPPPASAAPTPTPRPASGTPPEAPGPTGQTTPRALLTVAAAALGLLLLLGIALLWLSRPRDTAGLWLRLRLVGRALGVRRGPAETQAGYLRRVIGALPSDATSLLHPHGGETIGGRRLRARSAMAVGLCADLLGKAAFGPAGLGPGEEVLWRRAWGRVWPTLPLMLWRRLLAATPSLRMPRRGSRAGGEAPRPAR